MKKTTKIELLTTLVKYHEDVKYFAERYYELRDESYEKLKNSLLDFIHKQLKEHFVIEEMVVFPCVEKVFRNVSKNTREYCNEHAIIINGILKFISNKDTGESDLKELDMIIEKLVNHALAEEDKIIKVIENNPSLLRIIGREYLKNKDKIKRAIGN